MKCEECERSNGPHYKGPCEHGGQLKPRPKKVIPPTEPGRSGIRHRVVRQAPSGKMFQAGRARYDDYREAEAEARACLRSANKHVWIITEHIEVLEVKEVTK